MDVLCIWFLAVTPLRGAQLDRRASQRLLILTARVTNVKKFDFPMIMQDGCGSTSHH